MTFFLFCLLHTTSRAEPRYVPGLHYHSAALIRRAQEVFRWNKTAGVRARVRRERKQRGGK